MKSLKWVCLGIAVSLIAAIVATGTLGDESSDGKKLYIVQSEMERTGNGLREVAEKRKLLPVADDLLIAEQATVSDTFTVTDSEQNTVAVDLSFTAQMYNAENVLDHIVTVTNTGNYPGYIRTWFAFEMGDLTKEEFEASILLNQNSAQWTWGEYEYGVEIDGEKYAVICTTYHHALNGEETTAPNLLQIILKSNVSSDIVNRLDGNKDGKYEVRTYSQAVSDIGAWGEIQRPW